MLNGGSLLHTVKEPPAPAAGACTTAMESVADACTQGALPCTTY